MRGHLSWSDVLPHEACPHLSLIFLFPWKASALNRMRLPGFKPMHQFSSHNTTSFFSFCHRLSLGLLKSGPHLVSDSGYVFVHMPGGGALLEDLCTPSCWEVKVDWEPWPAPTHQIAWAVPHDCGLGGVTGMHYFSQMTWPVGFFIFFQLPNHLHDSLMGPLYQPIHLGVIGCGSQLLHTEEFAHLTNNVVHKVCMAIA